MEKPTRQTYACLQKAYDFFNRELFGRKLPHCLITLQRERSTYGYFSGSRWANAKGEVTDEIALNPAHFATRSLEQVMSTLVHEMVHLWQHHFGTPGRRAYHNKEWASKMESIGLNPSATGLTGGKRTGDRMTHYITVGGAFEAAVAKLLDEGFEISWLDRAVGSARGGQDTQKKVFRLKYRCAACGVNAWAKPNVSLICGDCRQPLASV